MTRRRRPGEQRREVGQVGRRRTTARAEQLPSGEVGLDATLAAHVATHDSTVERGRQRQTERSCLNAATALTRFEDWLYASGTSIDHLLENRRRGRSELAAVWVLAYGAQLARPGLITRASHRQEVVNLMAGLRARMIDVIGRDDPVVRSSLKRIQSVLEVGIQRPALPILPGDGSLAAVARAIDELPYDELVLGAVAAFHSLGFWGGGRASELLRHLRWRHIQRERSGERFTMTWPAGCKFQDEDVTLVRSTGLVADPVDALERLLAALHASGLEPGPDDAIFPGWIDGHAVLNPCDSIPESYRSQHDEHAEAMMRNLVAAHYRAWWTQAATAAGLEPTETRRVSPHGLRRGLATAAALAGVPLVEIRCELRHNNWAMTLRYTDGEVIDLDEVVALIATEDKAEGSDAGPLRVIELLCSLTGEGPNDGRCVIIDDDDARCPRLAAVYVEEHGQVCPLHHVRIMRRYPLTRPVPARDVEPVVADLAGHGTDVTAPEPDECAAAGCLNPTRWHRNLGDGRLSWLCHDHARAHALEPDGDWCALRVCDGVGCELTYAQIVAGSPHGALQRFEVDGTELRLCNRCWNAARHAADPSDLPSWGRREVLDGESCRLCTDGTVAKGWILDGEDRLGVCVAHRARWSNAGRPGRLDDRRRAPIDRRPSTARPCELCDDGVSASGWIEVSGHGRMAVCKTHGERWRRAGRPSHLPESVRAPVDRSSSEPKECELCQDGTLAVKRIPDGAASRVSVCAGHVGRWNRAGYPTRLSDADRAPIPRR